MEDKENNGENGGGHAFVSDRLGSYFRAEWKALLLVTVSGMFYNGGLLATPWFEGKLAQKLADILRGAAPGENAAMNAAASGPAAGILSAGTTAAGSMAKLVLAYIVVISAVQAARFIKRFYVRRFANNINRRMKDILYANLLRKSKAELMDEGAGELLTKAISDVDDCAEGMRKFTTEVFDTGVALVCYLGMLLAYDWRLAVLSLLFTPASYICADLMKKPVQRAGAAYKKAAGALSLATLDRAGHAMTYRIYGCEDVREGLYEDTLSCYENTAVRNSVWQSALPPLYLAASGAGVIFILYFGGKNVTGNGWSSWDIAAFTTFLSCFTKLTTKSSKVAKLFNSVQKAEVSWKRIKPLMKTPEKLEELEIPAAEPVTIQGLSFAYGDETIFDGISLTAHPGDIIGITGPVACGKSTFGRAFLCEATYGGSIRFGDRELSGLSRRELAATVGYLGHDPELSSDTVEDNVLCGCVEGTQRNGDMRCVAPDNMEKCADIRANSDEDIPGNQGSTWSATDTSREAMIMHYLDEVELKDEVLTMEDGTGTVVGSSGVRLSGGQAQRLALARTLAHPRPVIILDDPFSALDRKTEDAVFAHLREYAGDKVVFLISHRLYHFPEMEQVVFMDGGKAVVGSHEELMEKAPTYRLLYEKQVEGGEASGNVLGEHVDGASQLTGGELHD